MTKAQIVSDVSIKTGISRADVQLTIETLFQTIQDTMKEGEGIYFRGFGSFVNKKRARKTARNIVQNIALMVEEHYVPIFIPAKTFSAEIKERVKP